MICKTQQCNGEVEAQRKGIYRNVQRLSSSVLGYPWCGEGRVNSSAGAFSGHVSMAFLLSSAARLEMTVSCRRLRERGAVRDLKPPAAARGSAVPPGGVHCRKALTSRLLHHRHATTIHTIVPVHGSRAGATGEPDAVRDRVHEADPSHVIRLRPPARRICSRGATALFVRIRSDIVAAARPGPAKT